MERDQRLRALRPHAQKAAEVAHEFVVVSLSQRPWLKPSQLCDVRRNCSKSWEWYAIKISNSTIYEEP